MKKVLVACGTGMLTSVAACGKLEAKMKYRGYWPEKVCFETSKVDGLKEKLSNGQYDLVVTTAPIGFELPIKIMSGAPFLTGKGIQTAIDEIISYLKLDQS